MKRALVMLLIFATISVAYAKNRHNHTGQLLRMESAPCAPEDNGVAKAIFGGQMPVPGQEEKLCPEYIMQSEGLYYRIRPKDRKHPVLLPIGEQAQFHFQKDRLLLQIEDFDNATYEFSVLAIVPEDHGESLSPRTHIVLGPVQ